MSLEKASCDICEPERNPREDDIADHFDIGLHIKGGMLLLGPEYQRAIPTHLPRVFMNATLNTG